MLCWVAKRSKQIKWIGGRRLLKKSCCSVAKSQAEYSLQPPLNKRLHCTLWLVFQPRQGPARGTREQEVGETVCECGVQGQGRPQGCYPRARKSTMLIYTDVSSKPAQSCKAIILQLCLLSSSVMSDSAAPWTVAQQALLSMEFSK